MSKLNDNLNEILNIEPTKREIVTVESTPVPAAVDMAKVDEDFDLARSTIRDMVLQGRDALEELVMIAKESESPRAYEVVSNLIKAVTESAKDMMDLHKQVKDVKDTGEENPVAGSINVEKAVFIGSTNDLQRVIRAKREAASAAQMIEHDPED